MNVRSVLDGLPASLADSGGEVRVAMLDGPVDLSHPCFEGADLRQIDTLVEDPVGPGLMSLHGTHIASLIFGRPGSPVAGLAPGCQGLILPVFRDDGPRLSQVDLARAIEAAVREGADIVNISGGEPAPTGEPDTLLANALALCAANGVLVVAAVGNEGTDGVQVPAACPGVLAVGACTPEGEPLPTNNRGAAYRENGVLAPGLDIEGAKPGGGTARLSGSSFAAAVVTGVAALLLGLARREGRDLDPTAIRDLILGTATGAEGPAGDRQPAGLINVRAAFQLLKESEAAMEATETPAAGVVAACAGADPASTCDCKPAQPGYVYAIGTLGWDFGTEARRDGFIQQMDVVPAGDTLLPASPYDPNQLHRYLADNPWASDKLIWTCNLDGRMPLYALEAEAPVGMTWGGPAGDGAEAGPGYPPVSVVHKTFRDAILGQALAAHDPKHVARVSIPGTLTNRTVRLFSGQVVPVVVVHAQGLYTWNESILVDSLIDQINADFQSRGAEAQDEEKIRLLIRAFLDKVYYQFRNLGQSSPDRALNYAATNAFQLTRELAKGFLSGNMVPRRLDEPQPLYALDDITVAKSRYCRPDSDCWDVTVTFFDPENDRRSRVALLLTVDVSGSPPVSLAPSRQFLIGR